GGAEAGDVLARARDTEGEVELRRDRPPALADLPLPREPAQVDRHPAPAQGGAEQVGQLLEQAETLGAADAATARDDPLRLGQVDGPRIRGEHAADGRGRRRALDA